VSPLKQKHVEFGRFSSSATFSIRPEADGFSLPNTLSLIPVKNTLFSDTFGV